MHIPNLQPDGFLNRQNSSCIEKVQWGIIGCGDVCEIKSGPAFNKVSGSTLVAVMRRDRSRAEDYARRHGVPKFYDDAQELIDDPDINAVYIATPPATHEEYALRSIAAGKPVYIEKPLSVDAPSTRRILQAAEQEGVKATGAYYRRRLPAAC
jgi:predicted dehydrogenase